MNRKTGTRFVAIVAAGLVGLTLAGAAAHARGGRGREPSPDRAVARLTEKLSLTPEQQAQVKQILDAEFVKRQEVREAHRAERDAHRVRVEAELAKVLSADQMEKLRQLRDDRGRPRGDCGGSRGDCGGSRGDCGGRHGCRGDCTQK